MSFAYVLSIHADLRAETPTSVLAYLGQLVSGDASIEIGLPDEVESWWFSLLPTYGFGAEAGRLVEQYAGQHEFWFQQAIHDDDAGAVYGLLGLVATYAQPGPIGCSWLDFGDSPSVYLANEGELFVSSVTPPQNLEGNKTVEPPLSNLLRAPDVEELKQYGIAAQHVASMASGKKQDAALAQFLLVRSLWRACAEALGDADDTAIRSVVAGMVAVLDMGYDSAAAPVAPGWKILETEASVADPQATRSYSMRAIGDLQSLLNIVANADVNAAPFRLREGMRIRVLRNLEMTATNSEWVHTEDGSKHQFRVPVNVPVDAEMTVVKVYGLGHATCISADWPRWAESGVAETLNRRPTDYRLEFVRSSDNEDAFVVVSESVP